MTGKTMVEGVNIGIANNNARKKAPSKLNGKRINCVYCNQNGTTGVA
jgi:hypothetical protein